MVGGMAIAWNYLYFHEAVPDVQPGAVFAGEPPPPIEADESSDFDSVTDNSSIQLRDMAAYVKLLDRARDTNANALAKEARQDVYSRTSGSVPSTIGACRYTCSARPCGSSGTSRSTATRAGSTRPGSSPPTSSPNPYVCVFEDVPKGLPLGDNVNVRVVFNGYFLKKMTYQSRDQKTCSTSRRCSSAGSAGRPRPRPRSGRAGFDLLDGAGDRRDVRHFPVAVDRRPAPLARGPRPSMSYKEKPTEEIAPEALANYLDQVGGAEPGPADEDDSAWAPPPPAGSEQPGAAVPH